MNTGLPCPGWPSAGRYSATSQYGKVSLSGARITGRSIPRAGTTTRVATAFDRDGDGSGDPVPAGPIDGIGRRVGRAVGAAADGEGSGEGEAAELAPTRDGSVHASRPATTSATPAAVIAAGMRRRVNHEPSVRIASQRSTGVSAAPPGPLRCYPQAMGTRFALALGIVVGILAAAILALAVVSMAGGPAATVTLPPASAASSTPPSGAGGGSPAPPATSSAGPAATSEGAGASPGASPAASRGASPAASAGASSASGGLFGVGLAAPPLQVERLGGGTIDLASLRGKPVWVVFTGTYCPPCRDEDPFLESFATRYAGSGLVVVTVHEKDDAAAVSALTSELGITFPVGLDPAGSAGRDWKAIALPIHFWVDRDGIVRAGALGGVGSDVMASSLATILPGVEVTP